MTERYRLVITACLCLSLAGLPQSPYGPPLAFAQETAADTPAATDDDAPAPLSEDELEILVARIALYPDELVALVTSASLYPLQVVEAARYLDQLQKNTKLKPKSTWDGSIVSLLNYPQIVTMMSDDLDWTQSLGEALSYQQKDLLIAVQQLRDKAIADGIIKTDDKIKVSHDNDNVVIVAANPEKIYVPQYEPEMLYQPGYVAAPIAYYPEPYPNYYYPTATFFAGVVTGAVWVAAVDWNRWGVAGGRWNGNVNIDCDNCFNNIKGKVNINDLDWKNVDRSKIKFDKNQFNNIDRADFRNGIEVNSNRNKAIGNGRATTIRNKPGVSVNDIRKSKIDADRINRNKPERKAAQAAQNRRPEAKAKRTAGNIKQRPNAKRPVAKAKPAARVDKRAKRPSALGSVDSGRRTQIQSHRGRQAMSGGNRGGNRKIQRGGGRRR